MQKGRAGTQQLKKYFQVQIDQLLQKRLNVSERLGQKNSLTLEEQNTYYSSWLYAAVHIAVSISHLKSKEELAGFFSVPVERINVVLDFLLQIGILQRHNGVLIVDIIKDSKEEELYCCVVDLFSLQKIHANAP